MHKQSAYLYSNVHNLYTDIVAVSEGYRKVYARTLKLYKGIDNEFAIKLLNGDQRLLDAVGKTVHWMLMDRDSVELKLHKFKQVEGSDNSLVTIQLTEGDLERIDSGNYMYSAYLEDSVGKKTVLYGDSQYGVSVPVEVIENSFPQALPTTVITEWINSSEINYVTPDASKYTSAVNAKPELNTNNSALHTAYFYTTDFEGKIEIQATLENGVTDIISWAVIETVNISLSDRLTYANFNGVYSWIRFRYIPATGNTGTVDKILYRS